MRDAVITAAVAGLLLIGSALAAGPGARSPLGCPPSRTITTPPVGAQLVLVEGPALQPIRIAGSFDSPRSVAFLPDGRLLVAEQPGRLRLVAPGLGAGEISGVPEVLRLGHGGLLDIALDPEFASNGVLYLSYLQGSEAASSLRILRAKLDLTTEALVDAKVIFESTAKSRHDQIGGRLAVTPDGYLFLSVGDRWLGEPAQDLSDDEGSIIRIRTDGSIPEDNPFRTKPGARPEIWSYGHRNPQGLAYNPASGRLWSDEHGPQGGDELNLVVAGRNYGWPIISYGTDYSGRPASSGTGRPDLEQPVAYWAPLSIAPSGLAVEARQSAEVLWISTLAGQMLVRVTVGANCSITTKAFLKERLGRLRASVSIQPARFTS
jgi:glucose/arabinose dehydrogenase